MSKAKQYNIKTLYFTDKLIEKLCYISDYPLTVVTAPMGYGKTTAVKEYLKKSNVKVLWQNVYDSSVKGFWQGFCYALSELDREVADSLSKMGLPTDSVLKLELARLMRTIQFEKSTVLVIDDYHFVKSVEADEFLSFFIRNLPEKLHLVIISRKTFLTDENELTLKGYVNGITAEMLAFGPADIEKYYKLCGVTVDKQEVKHLYNYSEGWISALYLYLLEYVEYGSFRATRDISMLVRQTVFDPLSGEIKDFLFNVCVFESFTLEQAEQMWQKGNAEKVLSELIKSNAFISLGHITGRYSLHHIFRSCVEEFFEKEAENYKHTVWENAGQWYMKNREYIAAMDAFYKADNFDQLLAAIEMDKGANITGEHKEILIGYLSKCPENIRAKHHLAMLIYARRLFTFNERKLCEEVCMEFLKNLEADSNLSQKIKNNLMGEYEILLSFTKYNSISKMSEHHQKACKLMTTTSAVLDTRAPWGFGSPSILYMYYRESRTLAQEVEVIKKAMPYYYHITNGQGSGAEYVMEAEYYFNMGDMEDAEIAVHKALNYSRDKEQWSIMLCAMFLHAKISIFKGDYTYAVYLMNTARNILLDKKQYMLLHTIDLCEAYIYASLHQPQMIAEWIIEGNFKNTRLLFPAIPALNLVYGRVLLEKKEYLKLISLSDDFLQKASIFPNLLCHIYIHIHQSVAYSKIMRQEEAMMHLRKAFDIAIPDKLYMPFVESGGDILSMFEVQILKNEHREGIKEIIKIYKKYDSSVQAVLAKHFSNDTFGLSQREREVAALAARGFSNREIGERLFISENTVKLRLKNVFQKLNIQSRFELKNYYN